jgi:hypothetical protein
MQVLERESVDIAFIQEDELKNYSLQGFETFTYWWAQKRGQLPSSSTLMRNAEIDEPLMSGRAEV